MRTWSKQFDFIVALCAILGAGAAKAADAVPEKSAAQPKTSEAAPKTNNEADEKAIRATADEFVKAFDVADAKAIAALWTEQGEYENDDGTILCGRAALKASFAAHFKAHPAGKMEIKVESIRFPSRDIAVEEGLTCTTASGGLPDSACYRAVHVRKDGKWRIALCREWGAGENHMADLDWLLGTWRGQSKDQELTISFSREDDHRFILGKFASTAAGKTSPLGTMKIGIDPVLQQFMSWHFDPDGGHGHGVWLRERNHWAVDSQGVQGDGVEIAAVNVLTRFGDDELGWRSIDRMVGGRAQPDSPPIRLKRLTDTK
jgi:uncharacterized protein (TIGR02246 family)